MRSGFGSETTPHTGAYKEPAVELDSRRRVAPRGGPDYVGSCDGGCPPANPGAARPAEETVTTMAVRGRRDLARQ